MQDPVNRIDPSGMAFSDVDWGNVVGGIGLIGGGWLLIGGGPAAGPIGIIGIGVGVGAVLGGGVLLGDEFNNLCK